MPTAGKVGGVYASTTASTSTFTNAATTADSAKTRYSITDRSKAAWPLGSSVTVKVNGTTVTTGYSIEYAIGTVVFDAALTTETVTVTGTYQPVSEMGGFYSWTADTSVGSTENTDFVAARDGWSTYQCTGPNGSKVSAQRYWDTSGFRQRVGDAVLIKCFVDVSSGEHYAGWAVVTSDKSSGDVQGLVDEPIEFTITGGLYHRDIA